MIYRQFGWAADNHVPLAGLYKGRPRELCPITLGRQNGAEVAHVWQTGGESSGPLPDWRTLYLDKVSGVQVREGEWRTGPSKGEKPPTMALDYDANRASPYHPTRSFGDLRGTPFPK